MKSLFILIGIILSMQAAFATDIEITSEDCNYEVRKERDGLNLRVSKIIAVENTISAWDIDLPSKKFKLPLKEGISTTLLDSSGEETLVSFKHGILIYDQKAKSNFTRDTLELHISADLKHIRSAKFTRKGTGILSLFGSEKFECRF